MPVIGLTGNYGMGKTTALRLFREEGATTLNLDDIVDELLNEDHVLAGIRKIMGETVFSGKELNRSRVAEIIFTDKEKRDQLEGLIHPLVIRKMRDFLKNIDQEKIIIVEIPLLFEKGYEGEFDKTITVYTDTETAMMRLERKGIGRDEAIRRLTAQMPIEEKIRKADFVITNNGTIDDTKRQVHEIYEKLKSNIIKDLICHGRVREASLILGRPYEIKGTVIRGKGRGARLLNIPTANIETCDPIPAEGVYVVKVDLDDRTYGGVMNIGKNPTFGEDSVSLEVHILDFSGDLLGSTIRIQFIERLRPEKKFSEIEELKESILNDIDSARKILGGSTKDR